jgi:hypothetical protein
VEHYASSATTHNWPAIWMVPAVGAAVILLLFLVTFSERKKNVIVDDSALAAGPIPG